jgi:hypothetical protein
MTMMSQRNLSRTLKRSSAKLIEPSKILISH